MLLQYPDDLFFRKAIALHALVLKMGQNELQTGLAQRGKVTGAELLADHCTKYIVRLLPHVIEGCGEKTICHQIFQSKNPTLLQHPARKSV
jgi:hypothetical protein